MKFKSDCGFVYGIGRFLTDLLPVETLFEFVEYLEFVIEYDCPVFDLLLEFGPVIAFVLFVLVIDDDGVVVAVVVLEAEPELFAELAMTESVVDTHVEPLKKIRENK